MWIITEFRHRRPYYVEETTTLSYLSFDLTPKDHCRFCMMLSMDRMAKEYSFADMIFNLEKILAQ